MNWICKINGTQVQLLSPVTVQEYKESYGVYRLNITDDITLRDNFKSGSLDYSFIKGLEINNFDDINIIEIYKQSDIRRKYKGAFKMRDCTFSPIDNTVKVKHTIYDEWSYLKSKLDTKVNALQSLIYVPYVQAITCQIYSWFEFFEMKLSDFTPHPDADYYKSAFVDVKYQGSYPYTHNYIVVYYTEKVIVERGYIMDDTWTVYEDFGNSIEYIRKPTTGTFDDSNMFNFTDFYDIDYAGGGFYVFGKTKPGAPSIESVKENPDYTVVYEGSITLYDGDTTPKSGGVYVGVPADWEIRDFEFVLAVRNDVWLNGKADILEIEYRGISLSYFINQLIYYAAPSFTGHVKSTFLFNDHGATGEDDKYSSGFKDYVAENTIYTKYVIVKPDFIMPSANVLSTKFECTANNIINDLKKMFDLHDYIDPDGNYRIEHISYFNTEQGLDLRQHSLRTEYGYISENLFNKDIYEIIDSVGIDFNDQTIEYEDVLPMDDKENVKTNSINFISTDIEHMNRNLYSISTEGVVLVEVLQNNTIVRMDGILSGYDYQNIGLSLSFLLDSYYGWKLNKSEYLLFGQEKEAKTLAPIKEQEIDFITDEYLDVRNSILTPIGTGEVQKIEYSSADDNKYKVTLLYE